MKWVLMVLVLGHGESHGYVGGFSNAPAIAFHDFSTEKSCQDAREALLKASGEQFRTSSVCVKQ